MKKILIIIVILLVLLFAFHCESKKKPTNPDLDNPKYYFPINLEYEWTYVPLGPQCLADTEKTFILTVTGKNNRDIEGEIRNGWDIELSDSGGTSFAYQLGDTIFYKKDVNDQLPPYKYLVGPIQVGKSWTDRPRYSFDYSVVAFEDLPSDITNVTYPGCVKIRRTASDETKIKFIWWAHKYGRVKEAVYQADQCLQGEELKFLVTTPEYP